MLINVKDRIILLHNPKTGGRFREGACKERYFHTPSIELKKPVRNISHITYEEAKEAMPTFPLYKVITVIRNPYNRFVSAVNFSFNEVFGCNLEKSINNALDMIEKNEIGVLFSSECPWFCPQNLYTGEGVEVLKYENMDDWKRLCDILKFDITQVNIKSSYRLSRKQKNRIRGIYEAYDKEIFKIYESCG